MARLASAIGCLDISDADGQSVQACFANKFLGENCHQATGMQTIVLSLKAAVDPPR